MKIYDITATVSSDLPFYSENDPFDFRQVLQINEGALCNVSRVKMSVHTGTHADMPLHFVKDGKSCEDMPLDHFYGKSKLFRLPINRDVTKEDLEPLDISEGDIILLDTGQSSYMHKSELKKGYTVLTTEAAEFLVSKKIKTIGIDYISIDEHNSPTFPVHKILLGAGVTILEGLVLDNVPEGEYTISALPLKFKNGDGSPIRAILISES